MEIYWGDLIISAYLLTGQTGWLKTQHTGAKPVSTNRSFVLYRMDSELPIYARARVTMQAKRGTAIQTNVYIMENSQAESLLGRDDGIRLGIIKLDLVTVNRIED